MTESLAQAACTRAATCGSFVIHCSGSADADDAGSQADCEVEAQPVEYEACLGDAEHEFAASVSCFNEEIVAAASACYSSMMGAECPTKESIQATLNGGATPAMPLDPACDELMTLSSQCAARTRGPGLFPEDGTVIHTAAATSDKMTSMPCGARTLSTIEVEDGHFVFFCDLGEGALSMGEAGSLDQSSVLADQVFECPLDVFEAYAPDGVAPPQALIDDCDLRTRRAGPAGPILDLRGRVPTKGSHYCSGSGDAEFEDERCGVGYSSGFETDCVGAWYRCASWCFSDAFGWHQKSSEGQFGQEVDQGMDVVASCGASTRFRGWWDGDQMFDNTVLANYWQWHGLGPDGNVTVLPDHEIKFRGDSSSGAFHRAAGSLQDYNWP